MTDAGLKPRTVAEEMTAGRRNTPDFAWPAVALFLGLFAILGLSLWAAISGRISYAFGALINTGCIYVLYTIVHEAIHGNISLRRKDLRWLDLWIGTAACILLWLFCFPHLKQHMVHHARANTDEDPDIYARGSFPGWLFLRLPLALLKYFSPPAALSRLQALSSSGASGHSDLHHPCSAKCGPCGIDPCWLLARDSGLVVHGLMAGPDDDADLLHFGHPTMRNTKPNVTATPVNRCFPGQIFRFRGRIIIRSIT